MAPVQRDEAAREALAPEVVHRALGRVERVRVESAGLQCGQHAVAREQRDLAFGGRAAHQHGDLAEPCCLFAAQ